MEIPEYDDGRSKGFAIASFYTEEDAAKAIAIFDKANFNGRELNVRYDRFHRYASPQYQSEHGQEQSEEASQPETSESASNQVNHEAASPKDLPQGV